jgi:transposase-like protein
MGKISFLNFANISANKICKNIFFWILIAKLLKKLTEEFIIKIFSQLKKKLNTPKSKNFNNFQTLNLYHSKTTSFFPDLGKKLRP